jgi:hypothetical protein
VEGRPLTKKNTEEPNSNRTPSRETSPAGWTVSGKKGKRMRGYDSIPLAPRAVCGQTFEVGTVCVSSASGGLCGGLGVTSVPTATPDTSPVQCSPKCRNSSCRLKPAPPGGSDAAVRVTAPWRAQRAPRLGSSSYRRSVFLTYMARCDPFSNGCLPCADLYKCNTGKAMGGNLLIFV